MAIRTERTGTIAEVVIDAPPVNALTVQDWFDLADTLLSLGRDRGVHVVVLRAVGRGFCAGVDIKEMQRSEGFDALLGANRGCAAAFAAVYDCEVPVVVAVNGFCLGGGVGLAGNADVLLCSEDASLGLPEVDRGALGAATHLARLVPPARLKALVYSCERVTAQELAQWGSAWKVVPTDALYETTMAFAASLAAKPNAVLRAAKAPLTQIDPVDVQRSYRAEQGFTYELNLAGEGDRARDAFVKDGA